MFGFLKNLLGRASVSQAENAAHPPYAAGSTPTLRERPSQPPIPASGHAPSVGIAGVAAGSMVEVSLRSILAGLPLELQPRVAQARVGDAMLAIPLERVLPQLPHGAVRLCFGEVRQAFPHVFAPGADLDKTAVALPLAEVLTRINPNLIRRKRVQKRIEVPEEIISPFDKRGGGISIGKPDSASPVPDLNPGRLGRTASPASQAAPAARFGLNSAPTPPPPAAAPLPPHALISPRPAVVLPVEADGCEDHVPAAKTGVASNLPLPEAAPVKDNVPAPDAPTVQVPLTALAEGWPEAVRHEIVQSNLTDLKVAFPAEVMERALRAGRIAFTWRMIRGWTQAAANGASPVDSTVLELPLKVVAPLFLAYRRRVAKPVPKVEVDHTIPNLFFGFPQPESASGGTPAAVPAPVRTPDTNFYAWDGKSEAAKDAGTPRSEPSAGTKFISKYATPNEIVSRASALDGVAGALIALPDGLAVANQIPPEFNPDTLAAFLPQIFSKVSQCTKELRMGDLNNLNFTVGNVPWKIFRVNAIFFAAFGRVGEPLPTAQLAALAAELDHKPK